MQVQLVVYALSKETMLVLDVYGQDHEAHQHCYQYPLEFGEVGQGERLSDSAAGKRQAPQAVLEVLGEAAPALVQTLSNRDDSNANLSADLNADLDCC
jgi:hypothetical protein